MIPVEPINQAADLSYKEMGTCMILATLNFASTRCTRLHTWIYRYNPCMTPCHEYQVGTSVLSTASSLFWTQSDLSQPARLVVFNPQAVGPQTGLFQTIEAESSQCDSSPDGEQFQGSSGLAPALAAGRGRCVLGRPADHSADVGPCMHACTECEKCASLVLMGHLGSRT